MTGDVGKRDQRERDSISSAARGWAGEAGDFEHLTEADIRGTDYVGERPLDGGHPAVAGTLPFYRVEQDPNGALAEAQYRERFEKILSRYPNKQAALLPVLGLAHEIRGHLSTETLAEVAALLDLSPAYVRGVASFYTMYNKRPVGQYLIQVCTNVCCNVCDADDVLAAFLEHTSTEPGEVSADGRFTVLQAECLGACGFPTVVQINERYFENVVPQDVPRILSALAVGPTSGRE